MVSVVSRIVEVGTENVVVVDVHASVAVDVCGQSCPGVVNWVYAAHTHLPSPPTTREARLLPPVDTLE